jgi:predicted MFS family arabinose efflux permease
MIVSHSFWMSFNSSADGEMSITFSGQFLEPPVYFLVSPSLLDSPQVLMSKLYGLSHLGLLSGVVTTLHHMGGGFWAFVGGILFDSSGDYRVVFLLSAVTSAIAALCMLFVKEKRHNPK